MARKRTKSLSTPLVDPRKINFLAFFLNPKSPTFGIITKSALAAGYSQSYAENLTGLMPPWLSEHIGDVSMLQRAERNLSEALEIETLVPALGAFGPIFAKVKKGKKFIKVPVMKTDVGLLKIKMDTTEFVAERIGRAKYGTQKASTAIQVNIGDLRKEYS